MGRRDVQVFDDRSDGFFSVCNLGFQSSPQHVQYPHAGGLFASVSQVGMGFGVSPTPEPQNPRGDGGGRMKLPYADLYMKYVEGIKNFGAKEEEVVEGEGVVKKKKGGLKLKIKIANPSLRRLISGAVAGAVSRTAVAPLETIRTHLMVGSSGNSSTEVFNDIMKVDGWTGLFRGNLVNVIRVAPSKAIEVWKLALLWTLSADIFSLLLC